MAENQSFTLDTVNVDPGICCSRCGVNVGHHENLEGHMFATHKYAHASWNGQEPFIPDMVPSKTGGGS